MESTDNVDLNSHGARLKESQWGKNSQNQSCAWAALYDIRKSAFARCGTCFPSAPPARLSQAHLGSRKPQRRPMRDSELVLLVIEAKDAPAPGHQRPGPHAGDAAPGGVSQSCRCSTPGESSAMSRRHLAPLTARLHAPHAARQSSLAREATTRGPMQHSSRALGAMQPNSCQPPGKDTARSGLQDGLRPPPPISGPNEHDEHAAASQSRQDARHRCPNVRACRPGAGDIGLPAGHC